MNDNATIDDMITKFTKITNSLSFLGDSIDNDQKMTKVIRELPQSWEVKSTTLKELNDKEEIGFMRLIGNLKTHEMERKVREDQVLPQKKNVTFKSTPILSDENEDIDDEELFFLVKNVRRMFHKRGRFNNYKKGKKQGKEERKGNDIRPCYNCKKLSHCGLSRNVEQAFLLQEAIQEESNEGYLGRLGK